VRLARPIKFAMACAFLFAAACQPQLNSPLPQGAAAYQALEAPAVTAEAYIMQPGDVVSVSVYQEPDLSLDKVEIDRSGNLFLPLIGELKAAGRTQGEVSHDAELAYGRSYLRNPRVAVTVVEALSNTVTVEGEVELPGVYQIQPGSTLLTALALARSPKRTARFDEVLIFRTVNGQRMGARFDITEVRAGRAPDPQIMPGDVVVVGFSALRGLYTDILQAAPLFNVFTQF